MSNKGPPMFSLIFSNKHLIKLLNIFGEPNMNTNHILTTEQFKIFQAKFKELARNKNITSPDILLYNIVRGYPTDRGFSAITNHNKLHNGAVSGYRMSTMQLKWIIVQRPEYIIDRFDKFTTLPEIASTTKLSMVDTLKLRSSELYKIYETLL